MRLTKARAQGWKNPIRYTALNKFMKKEEFEEILDNIEEQNKSDLESLLNYLRKKFEKLIDNE